MEFSKFSINLVFFVLFITLGCTPKASKIDVKIPPFHEYYPILLNEAQKWQTDAYLDDVRIFLFPFSSSDWFIYTNFYSLSKDFESLGVELRQDGNITSEVFIYEYPINHHEPITESDLKIDGQQAFEYMIEKSNRRSLIPDKNHCSNMQLERILSVPEQPVIWSLTLWDCSVSAQYFYLDANSGEILDRSEVNIKPTRFPTPSPSVP